MTNTPRVLVIDGLSETEAVLRAVLEPQGAQVERRRSRASSETDAQPPEVMVVDLDDESSHEMNMDWPNVPRVILSSAPCGEGANCTQFLEKPFHYPELVRLVQSLLDLPTGQRRAA